MPGWWPYPRLPRRQARPLPRPLAPGRWSSRPETSARASTKTSTVGRQGELVIDDEFASGRHARFRLVRGLWYVQDLGSTNGTSLNGLRIHANQLLRKGDKVRIGHTVMVVVSV